MLTTVSLLKMKALVADPSIRLYCLELKGFKSLGTAGSADIIETVSKIYCPGNGDVNLTVSQVWLPFSSSQYNHSYQRIDTATPPLS
jgi:hypothetical protein